MSIQDVVTRHQHQLMTLPNVNGVSIGEKNGEPTITVYVTHKVPESELQTDEIVPRNLEGFPTDVEELGVATTEML